ncbi:hypothetical protein H1R20_g2274, partial [Candolleomyces eurysporus]
MPRGIPNAKRDDTGFRYTTFHVPLVPNPKHVSSTYLKSETQTLWYRKNQAKGKGAETAEDGPSDGRVVARKDTPSTTEPRPIYRNCIIRPGGKSEKDSGLSFDPPQNGDEYDVTPASSDPFDTKLAIITVSLRDRMRFYKLRVTPNAAAIASTFNEQFKPEIITSDPKQIQWLDNVEQADVVVGDEALRIGNPEDSGYRVRWPIHAANFNARDYASMQLLLSDTETLIEHTLRDKLDINRQDYKNFSVALVIPDLYNRPYVRELVQLLLVTMGFKQLCAQQESLAATYGAGMSNACVVDIGSKITTISCVDEGLVLPDTRLALNMGGDDVTEFLYVLLQQIKFPYRDADLNRSYDWAVLEDLKTRLCTLAESDVALNLYDFIVRRPHAQTEKYGLRAYDEVILAPMCLFEPRVIDFDSKTQGLKPLSPNVTEEIIGHQTENVAMAIDQPEGGGEKGPSEVIDVDEEKPPILDFALAPPPQSPPVEAPVKAIDVPFEASKLPLDVAIFNSARAAGGDDKIRKYLQAVLVIGGTALIPGMAHALESRLQAIATPLVPNMEKVQIIPPPKEVDPRVLSWKGAAVLGKMESVSELWISPSDWDMFGMRALKERCYYL